MDIVIVLDGSNSIYPWYEVQNFLSNILSKFHISSDQMQVNVNVDAHLHCLWMVFTLVMEKKKLWLKSSPRVLSPTMLWNVLAQSPEQNDGLWSESRPKMTCISERLFRMNCGNDVKRH